MKKQARSNKQQGKATQHTQGSHFFMHVRVCECVRVGGKEREIERERDRVAMDHLCSSTETLWVKVREYLQTQCSREHSREVPRGRGGRGHQGG